MANDFLMATVMRARAGSGMRTHAAYGLRMLAVMLGVFLVFQALSRLEWLTNSRPLTEQLERWMKDAAPSSRWYIQTIAIPGVPLFARVIVLGECFAGVAMIVGFWIRLAAALALILVLNFHFASGELFRYEFLTNAYGLPVLGGLVALAFGGGQLPWSASK
jgi:uncharacterized membrane protein YphA (DoxX/SURF4 family)